MMCNHRSYLDPALIVHDVLACPVSKAEVARWPIVGYGAKVTGTIFLKRESATSRKVTLESIDQTVKSGLPVILFPEGTTHSTPLSGTFRAGGFKLAALGGYSVVPVAIEYSTPDDYWVGDDDFVGHFIRRFGLPTMPVCVRYGAPVQSDDVEYLITQTRSWIDAQLPELKQLAIAMKS